MEIVNLPRISDYWSTADNFLKTYVWSNTMSKNQFLLLLRFWHFEIEGDNERLNNKVAHLMNNLHEKVKKIYCPAQSLTLDECIVLWRGLLILSSRLKTRSINMESNFKNYVIQVD